MRLLIRLTVLALAAFGAKTLYERFAGRGDALEGTRDQFVDRTSSAFREVGSKIGEATQNVAAAARQGANDVSATAARQAEEVKDATREATRSVADEFESSERSTANRPSTSSTPPTRTQP